MAATLDLAALTLGTMVTSGKGAKSAPLSAGGAPALWAPPGLRAVAFEPRPYSGAEAQATRVNLVLRAGDLEPELRALDAWAVEAATAASTELFGKAMTREQVAERYTPLLKESDKYPATWRVKINLAGSGAVRLWSADGSRREAPEAWTVCTARPLVLLRGLWLMGRDFGVLAEAGDVQLEERAQACPF